MADILSRSSVGRLVVIGRNSVLWSRIADRVAIAWPDSLAVGHRDIRDLQLTADDNVWIFSYASDEDANKRLFDQIAAMGGGRCFYISSATANIINRTRCYPYPRVKSEGEGDAARILGAVAVRIGMIHDDVAELPAGSSAATRLDDLVAAMAEPGRLVVGHGGVVHLYTLVTRPFSGAAERLAYRFYGSLLSLCGRWPCLLRPFDLLLRAVGWRWYGYFRLSNEQCRTTI